MRDCGVENVISPHKRNSLGPYLRVSRTSRKRDPPMGSAHFGNALFNNCIVYENKETKRETGYRYQVPTKLYELRLRCLGANAITWRCFPKVSLFRYGLASFFGESGLGCSKRSRAGIKRKLDSALRGLSLLIPPN